ncbi:MAG: uroporphyrinogen-III C-methyltransferase [Candidatus Sumerlaeota bacterium]|nr:uroporphyrinogen-III C-methyltransferase [Candidatus Sumerlaeota bacterium]
MPGRVYLVGAGPGAPGLLTLRGRALLAAADVVVFDALVNPALRRYARADAERIDAGKRAGAHTLKQEEINALLVERARAGRTVVRLKGGDPFIFGRGGEEAVALEAAGIPYEIVPGVSSAYAVPAYAGVAVTQRGVSSSVHVFTAQGADSKNEAVEWARAARLGGTLVFLMGYGRIGEICRALVAEGSDPRTPVAVIQWGTTIEQNEVFSTLAGAERDAEQAGLGSPAVVVVGETASAERRFHWTDHLPLFRRTIGFTRDARRAVPWLEAFEGLGARVFDYPLVHTFPIPPTPDTEAILDRLNEFDWIVFTNSLGIEAFFERLAARDWDARRLAGRRFAAIGPETAEALAARGVRADLAPAQMTQDGLARDLPMAAGTRVLLPGSPRSRDTLQRAIERRGGAAVRLPLYDSAPEKGALDALVADLEAGPMDFLVVLTPLAAQMLVEGRSTGELKRLLGRTSVVSFGAQAARVLDGAGRPADLTLGEPTLDALIRALTACENGDSHLFRGRV